VTDLLQVAAVSLAVGVSLHFLLRAIRDLPR
jgi:hypothetical protein